MPAIRIPLLYLWYRTSPIAYRLSPIARRPVGEPALHYIYTAELVKNKAFSPTCEGIFADFTN